MSLSNALKCAASNPMKYTIKLLTFLCLCVMAIRSGDFASSMLGIVYVGYIMTAAPRIIFNAYKKRWRKIQLILISSVFCIIYFQLLIYYSTKNHMEIETLDVSGILDQKESVMLTIRSSVFANDYLISRHHGCIYVSSASYSLDKMKHTKKICNQPKYQDN